MKLMRIILAVLAIPLILVACGGGSDSSSGPAVDNSLASGTFTVMEVQNGSGVQTGVAVFDGAGNVSYTPTGGTPQALTYTSFADRSIKIDTSGGMIRSGGNFMVLNNVTGGNEGISILVKTPTTTLAEAQVTYNSGEFDYDTTSATSRLSITTMNGGTAGAIAVNDITNSSSFTGTYTYSSANGTFVTPASATDDAAAAAISPDYDVLVYSDSATTVTSSTFLGLGLQAASAATVATVNGTYMLYSFSDGNSTGTPAYQSGRTRVILDGAGSGSYQDIVDSSGGTLGSGTFTYAVNNDGSFTVSPTGGGTMNGYALADGSVFIMVEDNVAGGYVSLMVAVKQ